MYHFVPKNGIGIQKDGTKLHCFDYEASFHNRSKDFYDEDIQKAIDENNIHRLSDLLVAAYTDLVLDGNSDMTSYMYLMDKATHALSEAVIDEIGEDNAKHGGVALALVTELVATGDAASLFKRAVLSREDMDDLEGLEGINESYVRKVFAYITPMVETKGVLLNNGVDITQGWGKELAEKAPSIDQVVKMDFEDFQQTVNPSPEAYNGTDTVASINAPTGDALVAQQLYAGMLSSPGSNISAPPLRAYMLENNMNLQVANEFEKVSHERRALLWIYLIFL